MEPDDLFYKDKSVFARDDFTCLTCSDKRHPDELWVAPHEPDEESFTVCEGCASKSIDSIFEDGDEVEEEQQRGWVQALGLMGKALKRLLGEAKY